MVNCVVNGSERPRVFVCTHYTIALQAQELLLIGESSVSGKKISVKLHVQSSNSNLSDLRDSSVEQENKHTRHWDRSETSAV